MADKFEIEVFLKEQIAKRLDTMERNFKSFGKNARRSTEIADKGVNRLNSSLSSLQKFAIGFASISLLKGFIGSVSNAGDTLDKFSSRVGVGVQSLQELQFAGELTGVPINQLNVALQRFARRTQEAAKGTGESKDALMELGITFEDLNTKSPEELLNQVADGMQNVQTDAERTRIAFKLFDTEGVALVNTLKGGSKELEKMRAEFRRLGGGLSEENIRNTVRFKDEMAKFGVVLNNIKLDVVLPALKSMSNVLSTLTSEDNIGKIAVGLEAAKVALVGFLSAFAAGKILGVSQSLFGVAKGITSIRTALVALNINPFVALATGIATLVFGLQQFEKSRRIETLGKVSGLSADKIVELKDAILEVTSAENKRNNAVTSAVSLSERVVASAKKRTEAEKESIKTIETLLGLENGLSRMNDITLKQLDEIIAKKREEAEVNEKTVAKSREQLMMQLVSLQRETTQISKTESDKRVAIANAQFDALKSQATEHTDIIAQIEQARTARISAIRIKEIEADRIRVEQQNLKKLEFERSIAEESSILFADESERRFLLVEQENLKRVEQAIKLGVDLAEVEKFNNGLLQDERRKANKEEIDKISKLRVDRQKKESQTNKQLLNDKKRTDDLIIDSSLSAAKSLLSISKKTGGFLKGFAIIESVINGIRAVQRTLAEIPAPLNIPAAAAVGVAAAANTAVIASQAFETGGLPRGKDAIIRVNESGQEAVLNAQATSSLGVSGVNALNNGTPTGTNITNEISYSPTFQLGDSPGQDLLSALENNEEEFADFFESLSKRGFLSNA